MAVPAQRPTADRLWYGPLIRINIEKIKIIIQQSVLIQLVCVATKHNIGITAYSRGMSHSWGRCILINIDSLGSKARTIRVSGYLPDIPIYRLIVKSTGHKNPVIIRNNK
uniref:ORF 109 protein n=1 Tax=Saccharomyces cerevisiae TaxID=4932 RepID=A2NY35_YEASX|nr:ORF 109 [Saccharomyces cerevisiae]